MRVAKIRVTFVGFSPRAPRAHTVGCPRGACPTAFSASIESAEFTLGVKEVAVNSVFLVQLGENLVGQVAAATHFHGTGYPTHEALRVAGLRAVALEIAVACSEGCTGGCTGNAYTAVLSAAVLT
jgi:hypothetical protein